MEKNESKQIVTTFSFASFLHDMGADMVYSVWPLFVTQVLGANMQILGLIDGLGDAVVSISQAVSGYISDRIGKRKIFIWTGYLFGGLSKVGYAMATSWPYLIPLRILDRMGKMRGAPRDAMIADVSTRENRGKNFGVLRMMDNLGAVVGVIISILLIKILDLRTIFYFAAVPSLVGTLLIVIAIKEKPLRETKLYKGFTLKLIDKNFALFLTLSALFALGSFSYSFLLIYAKRFGVSDALIPVLYLLFDISAFAGSLPFGKLADNIGRKPVLVISFLLWIVVCLGLVISQAHWMIVGAFVLYGLHKGALDPVQRAFVSELAPEHYRASGLGTFQLVTGIAALPASLVAGVLWDKVSISSPFYFALVLSTLALILLFLVKENPR